MINTPWHVSKTDETLIKDCVADDVATTFFGATDYRDQFERRSEDAANIVKLVNGCSRLASAMRQLIVIAGVPITDRQKAVFAEAKAALDEVS